jgi:DNA-binding MarR family transcriptional regulator
VPSSKDDLPGREGPDPPKAALGLRPEGAGFLVADVNRLFRKAFDRRMRQLGLSWPMWRVLSEILQEPGQSQAALARRLSLGRAALGDLVRALVELDLVWRERPAAGRREWLVFPKETARTLLPEVSRAAEWIRSVSSRGVPAEEIESTRRTLAAFRANLTRELE